MSSRHSTAFTLIEMLIALALISTIVTMVYGSYAATSRSLDVYASRMACGERAHLVLRLMARQLRSAYMPRPEDIASDHKAKSMTRPAAFRAGPGDTGEVLDFTTTSGFGGSVGLARVRYRYGRSAGVLATCCEPSGQSAHDVESWQPILRDITNIELRYHDGRHWRPGWDSSEAKRLPQAVRIALTITDKAGRAHSYRTTVPIICRTTPEQRENNRLAGQP